MQGHALTFLAFSKGKKRNRIIVGRSYFSFFLFVVKNYTVKTCFSIILRARGIWEHPLMLICVPAPSGLSVNCTRRSVTAHLSELPFRIKGEQIIKRQSVSPPVQPF